MRHLADVLGMDTHQDNGEKFDKDHNILCMKNTEYYFSGTEIREGKTLEHLKRLHLRLEEVREI